MRKKLSQNWKQGIFYLLIVAMLIGMVLMMGGQNKQTQTKYSEIVGLFRTNQVSEYEIDLSSGGLQYKLFSDKEKADYHKYNVPNVAYFIDDISEYVNDYNAKNPNKQIVYNYKKGAGGSILISMILNISILENLSVLLNFSLSKCDICFSHPILTNLNTKIT